MRVLLRLGYLGRLLFFKNIFSYYILFLLHLFKCLFIHLSLSLHRLFSSCGEQRLPFVAVCGLLLAVDSLVLGHGSRGRSFSSCNSWVPGHRLSNCDAWASSLHGMWDLPTPGIKHAAPALAGRFFTTEPPEKSREDFSYGKHLA